MTAPPPAGPESVPAWSTAYDPGLVHRLRLRAERPGLVRTAPTRALLARHRSMASGVPLAEVLARRVPAPPAGQRERPVVAPLPLPAAEPAGEADPVPVVAARAAADRDPVVLGPAGAGPVPAMPAAVPVRTAVAPVEPGSAAGHGPGPVAGVVVRGPAASEAPGRSGPRDPRGAVALPSPPGSEPGGSRPDPSGPDARPWPIGSPPGPAAGPANEPAPATSVQAVRPSDPLPTPAVAPPAARTLTAASGTAVVRGEPQVRPALAASVVAPVPAAPIDPGPRPVVPARRRLQPVGPVPLVRPLPAAVTTDPGDPARPAVRPAAAGPLADEVHRLVVRELAASAAPEAPAVIRRAVAAPAAPTAAPRVPAPRADRPAERPVRPPAPVDVGRLTEAVSRRLARRGAVDDERRGMGR